MDQTCDPGSGWKIERPTTDLDKVDTVRNFSDNSSIQSVQAPGPARLGTVFYILFNAFIDREKLHQSYHSPSISNKTFTICGKIKGCFYVYRSGHTFYWTCRCLFFLMLFKKKYNMTFVMGTHFNKVYKGTALKIKLNYVFSKVV